MRLVHATGVLESSTCLVMGIVNRTPDSFYDGGRMEVGSVVDHALELEAEGASVLDIGAVKAGPGEEVDEATEWSRLEPIIGALAEKASVPLSVETSRPEIVRRALASGASIVNDVSALADPELAAATAQGGAALILMHNGGQIRGRPQSPVYEDVVAEVGAELDRLAGQAIELGVDPASIVIDPGLDFGKTTFHSLELVRRLDELTSGIYPVLLAASRKSVVGETLDLPPDERLEGSLALAAAAVFAGVAIVRVHDVRATLRLVHMLEAVAGHRRPSAPLRGLWN